MFDLAWERIDFEARVAWATDTKSGEDYPVPLNDEALAILQALPRIGPWLFPSENPETHLDARNWYRRVYQPACKKAGITDLRFHDLRHTFGSRLARTGAHPKVIQALMGHKTAGMTERYTHVEDSDLHDAVARMGSATRTATDVQRIPNVIKDALDNIRIDQSNWNGPRRDRTCDPLIKSQLLYQLS